jgi:hypothetical protein
MIPGLLPPVVPRVLSRDREGHVKQKVSRREPPLLTDVMLFVGVTLPEDEAVEAVDDDEDNMCDVDVIVAVSLSDCLLSLEFMQLSPPLSSSSVLIGEEHDKLIRSFASRRTSLLLPSMSGSLL